MQVKVEVSTGIVAAPIYFIFSSLYLKLGLHFARFSIFMMPLARLTLSEKNSAYILRYSRLRLYSA